MRFSMARRAARKPVDAARYGSCRVDPGNYRRNHASSGPRSAAPRNRRENLCMAGGVALNCVGNGRILREGPFKKLWIQAAAGDAGGAIGAALAAWHQLENKPRQVPAIGRLACRVVYLGPAFNNREIEEFLDEKGRPLPSVWMRTALFDVSQTSWRREIVGWVQGRMEFGPRALGGRSIIGDPRNPKMQSVMNLKIKYRENRSGRSPLRCCGRGFQIILL